MYYFSCIAAPIEFVYVLRALRTVGSLILGYRPPIAGGALCEVCGRVMRQIPESQSIRASRTLPIQHCTPGLDMPIPRGIESIEPPITDPPMKFILCHSAPMHPQNDLLYRRTALVPGRLRRSPTPLSRSLSVPIDFDTLFIFLFFYDVFTQPRFMAYFFFFFFTEAFFFVWIRFSFVSY